MNDARHFASRFAALGHEARLEIIRRLLKRHTGITPGRYRRRFGAPRGGMSRDRLAGL